MGHHRPGSEVVELDNPPELWLQPLAVELDIRPFVGDIPLVEVDMLLVVEGNPAVAGDNVLVGAGIPEVGLVLGIQIVEAHTRVAGLDMLALVGHTPLAVKHLF